MTVPLPAAFYERNPEMVAPELLGKLVVRGSRVARIVEVEAYGGAEDPASHAHRGPTRRNASMFGPAGRWYVYFSYGMHWCANLVCRRDGSPGAVLLRAAAPEQGVGVMRRRRATARSDDELCRGPARLCAAFGIDGSHDGSDAAHGVLRIVDDGVAPPEAPVVTTRIGISRGVDIAWRWSVQGSACVSRQR